jgi:NAD+ kinase
VTSPPRSITVFTHTRPADTEGALRRVVELAAQADVEVRLPSAETEKFGLIPGAAEAPEPVAGTDLALVLGGDGTILTALRDFAGTGVPVFAVNYGAIGFLATIEPWELEEGVGRAMRGEFDVMSLPGLLAATAEGDRLAVNDVSLHRRPDGRVAELAYSVEGEQLGEVRCDGLVVATPAGSTGYNLANGGPVLAWGVEGFVVSFIAPHSLTARALVVAPSDLLSVHNRSQGDVDISLDGRPAGQLGPGDAITASFLREAADLAQVPGSSFYRRLRQKFGRLAS